MNTTSYCLARSKTAKDIIFISPKLAISQKAPEKTESKPAKRQVCPRCHSRDLIHYHLLSYSGYETQAGYEEGYLVRCGKCMRTLSWDSAKLTQLEAYEITKHHLKINSS